jgi:hypothetical protein
MSTVDLIIRALLARGEKEQTAGSASRFRKFTRTWQATREAGALIRAKGSVGVFWFVSSSNGSLRVGSTSMGSRAAKVEVRNLLIREGSMLGKDYFSRPILIHICKDGTISYRTRTQPVFNGRALAVFSVDTEQQAEDVQVLFGRKQYEEHPEIPGKAWYRWNDFRGEVDDLERVGDMIRSMYWETVIQKAIHQRTTICYGINRKVKGRIEHQNHKAEIEGAFDDAMFGGRVLQLVLEKHPGWSLTGYAPAGSAVEKEET